MHHGRLAAQAAFMALGCTCLWPAHSQMTSGAAAGSPTTLPSVVVNAPRSEDGVPALDRVSTSGSRLGLSTRDLPGSVDVITQEEMQQRGARTFEEAVNGSAGVLAGGNTSYGRAIASVRGFTQGSVTYLYDGSRVAVPTMANRPLDSWNFDRIEVLRGPASVIHGDGAIGAAINYVTKQPDPTKAGAEGMVSYGSFNSYRLGLGVGGALGSDAGAFRLDVSRSESDGYVQNDREVLNHLTGGLAFRLRDDLRLDVSLDYSSDRMSGYLGTPLLPIANASRPTSAVTGSAGFVLDERTIGKNYNFANGQAEADTFFARARFTWKFSPEWTLRNELGYYHAARDHRYVRSPAFRAPNLVDRGATFITHEHTVVHDRMEINQDGRLFGLKNRLAVGVELSNTDFSSERQFSDSNTNAALRVDAFAPTQGLLPTNPALFAAAASRMLETARIDNVAWFAEDAINPTDSLTLVGGVRVDRIDLDRGTVARNTGTTTGFKRIYDTTSYRLGAVQRVGVNTNLYAQHSTASGLNGSGNLLLVSEANAAYPLTEGKQWEAGVKQSLIDGSFDWTIAAFRIVQTNVLSRSEADPNVTVNNGKVSSRGVELSADWRVTRQFRLSGNASVQDAQFDTLIEAGGLSRVGNLPPHVPRHTANLWADYTLADVPVTLGVGARWVGATYLDNANTVRLESYRVLDAYASYRFSRTTTATLRVRNLTDETYASWEGANATRSVMVGAPRSVDLALRMSF